jgi:dTDP-glucose 4,6-dehydratase
VRSLVAEFSRAVTVLDSLTGTGKVANLDAFPAVGDVHLVRGDVRDQAAVDVALQDVDVIVHAAAEVSVAKSIAEGGSAFVSTNVMGTQVLLDAARHAGLRRFVLLSSAEVYGSALTELITEDHPLFPQSPYAGSKAAADRLTYAYHCTYGLDVVILRLFNNYGPNQHPQAVIPRFIVQALVGAQLTVEGHGNAQRDWLHVSDTARAVSLTCGAPISDVAGRAINLATGTGRSVASVAASVLGALGLPTDHTVAVCDRPGQVMRHVGSAQTAGRLLGWAPQVQFDAGLLDTVLWYRDRPEWWHLVDHPSIATAGVTAG